ncbi:proline--tRNA ligase [Aquicella lusitana]|uniref:Proline--tRNA ligase n=1 Tax=Aquicella lusitana TaxID=254246 RepID=A0A370GZ55_9COXI|nr:proline--tRNA ligase [Aquicella lusitana]RDI48576.1 prolyl-tRNA synthetase [Aquicella lusitana]VVC74047.1 Proline--tRNA ligase [Aquicella lusitana]
MKSNKTLKTAITPTREENYPEWYQQVIKAADLAEVSPVRGCMIIKPWGFAIWENIQSILNEQFKATGHKNLYFPLLIPMSFMQKEAEHIEGFAKECAVVTHHRLATNEEGKLVPSGELEEPYIIRPTSETIIGDAFARWIQSYRDLPLLINQWANVMRWEMRTRMFLRTTEFLWQEGHTAHATAEEAMEESRAMLDLYADFAENYMAMPVIKGEKTASERFPGAVNTYCIESMMQDKKALQAGTSHFLGQHFSRGFNIKYLSAEGREEFVWTTSWGVSTRLIGGLIMTHSDDNGLVLPPRLAPSHVVILPVIHKEEDRANILTYCDQLADELRHITYYGRRLGVEVDKRDLPGGEKAWGWVKKGIPLRLEIGNKEYSANTVFMGRRDKEYKDRKSLPREVFLSSVTTELEELQTNLLQRAHAFQKQNTQTITDRNAFYEFFNGDGGFALAHWNGDPVIEEKIKQELSVTIRCIPFSNESRTGKCIFTGEASSQQALFAKAY